ncbi:MAG: hypothetical protein WDN75_12440 [Bacteroidota bacterium]
MLIRFPLFICTVLSSRSFGLSVMTFERERDPLAPVIVSVAVKGPVVENNAEGLPIAKNSPFPKQDRQTSRTVT